MRWCGLTFADGDKGGRCWLLAAARFSSLRILTNILATPEKLNRVLGDLVGEPGGEPKEGEPGPLERVRVRSMALYKEKC